MFLPTPAQKRALLLLLARWQLSKSSAAGFSLDRCRFGNKADLGHACLGRCRHDVGNGLVLRGFVDAQMQFGLWLLLRCLSQPFVEIIA